MSDVAIRVEGLGKRYRIGAQQRHDTLRDSIVDGVSRLKVGRGKNGNLQPSNLQPSTEFWALRDVSFEVKRGEVVGIIGRNGAGKSTLLKILSRITEPTEGRAEIHGRVGSLLEVGTGFHPELTGRENIFLNGAILGMHRHEIAAKFDEIVAFSEIEKFLDTPVKRYSSGMYVRLAFAVAAHLEPEILLVDEVLAVGDAQFQKKCLGKMGDVAREGRTVLFVSHNMAAVENLCRTGLLLDAGRISLSGPVHALIQAYSRGFAGLQVAKAGVLAEDNNTGTRLIAIRCIDVDGMEVPAHSGDDITIEMQIEVPRPVEHAVLTIGLNDLFGSRVTVLHSEIAGHDMALHPGRNSALCHMPSFPLVPGSYGMDVLLLAGLERLLWAPGLGPLTVGAADYYGSGRLPDPEWSGHCYVAQTWSLSNL